LLSFAKNEKHVPAFGYIIKRSRGGDRCCKLRGGGKAKQQRKSRTKIPPALPLPLREGGYKRERETKEKIERSKREKRPQTIYPRSDSERAAG
jgi:hypothetical protein